MPLQWAKNGKIVGQKVQAKKTRGSNKSISRKIFWPKSIFCNFKNGQKSIFELGKSLKMQYHEKKFRFIWFHEFFSTTFLNFLARCACSTITVFKFLECSIQVIPLLLCRFGQFWPPPGFRSHTLRKFLYESKLGGTWVLKFRERSFTWIIAGRPPKRVFSFWPQSWAG